MNPSGFHEFLQVLSGSHLAPIFRRVHRVIVAISILFLLDAMALASWLLIAPGNSANHVIVLGIIVSILFVSGFLLIAIYLVNDFQHRKHKRLWESMGAYPCGTCAYPNIFHHTHTTCSECGTRLNTILAINYWNQYIKPSVSPISLVAPLLRAESHNKKRGIVIFLIFMTPLFLIGSHSWPLTLSFFALLYLVPMLVSRRLYRKFLIGDYACYSCLRSLQIKGDMAVCLNCDKHSKLESIHTFWHNNAVVHWDIMLENEDWEAPSSQSVER